MELQASSHPKHNRLAIAALALWSLAIVLVVTFLFDTWPHDWLKDDQREPWFHAVVVIDLTLLAFFCNYLHHHIVDEREQREREREARANASARPTQENAAESAEAEGADTHESIIHKIFGSWIGIVLIFIVPTAAYFGAHTLHSPLPEPAIFVMAVVAIYVAAEHYASLDKQRDNLRWVTEELGKQVSSIQNALGTKDGRHRIYGEYSQRSAVRAEPSDAQRSIHAIYRYFDIDDDWLRADSWDDYLNTKQTTALVAALRNGERQRVRIVSPLQAPVASSGGDEIETADRFHNFMGLLWHWLALRKLQQTRGDFDFRIAIAQTPHWVHVVNGKVFQIKGDFPHALTVRDLTLEMGDMAPRFATWVREEVETLCAQGESAEDFIAAVLRDAAAATRQTADGSADDVGAILRQLGWEAWHIHAATRYEPGRERLAGMQHKFAGLIAAYLATTQAPRAQCDDT
ncbi:MAG: hypothetical protein E6Q40_04080 [Cupriavidus sp.]|nr:MAG: hypothetical protein E6Q40_04080 [Cupriavidus sp.]